MLSKDRPQNKNLHPIQKGQLTKEEARERAINGARKSIEVRRRKKTLAEYFQAWAAGTLTDDNKAKLMQLGIDPEDATNKAIMVIPIIKNIAKGDVKSLELAIDLLGENKKKELELKKLREENKLLKLQQEQLRIKSGEDSYIEDLSPLADLLKITDEEKEGNK